MNIKAMSKILLLGFSLLLLSCSGSKETPTPAIGSAGGNYNVMNLADLNSAEDDFAPFVLPNGSYLLYTSNRPAELTKPKIDNKSLFGEAIYKAEGNGTSWKGNDVYNKALLKAGNHGAYALSPDGEQVYFSAAYLEPNVGGSDIYVMEKTIGQWSTPMSVFALNTKWWEAQPAVSPDGNILVFSSNRDTNEPDISVKGYRQPHLWMSVRDADGNWNTPTIIPAPVNSEFSEISPFFSPDGFMYFATNRYDGQGFDIVRCRRIPTGWSNPERMPAPINSTSDDVFPFVTSDRNSMYFASNRPGGKGGLDLYKGNFPSKIKLRGIVSEESDNSVLAPAVGVSVVIEDLSERKTWTVTTDREGLYVTELSTNKEYLVRTGASECYMPANSQDVNVGFPLSLDTTFVRDFTIARLVFPNFELGRYNIPFFVTGYYYPNTNTNLDQLSTRISNGELNLDEGGNTPYIDRYDEDYRSYASRIETIFDSIYTSIIDNYLPMFNSCALKDENLLLEVSGYVDPRGLTPGFYPDKTITTKEMTIRNGERMSGQQGNTKLANLRAYYTLEMIDKELSTRSARYRELKSAGRIILHAHGIGIDTETGGEKMQDPAKRRIDIKLQILPAGSE
jgi:Tol biopolymer transport system component